MNDFFAVEPTALDNHYELRILLNHFGIQRGRYISKFPVRWESMVRESFKHWSEVERKRANRLLQLLRDRKGLIEQSDLAFRDEVSWFENVISTRNFYRPSPFVGGVAKEEFASDPFFKTAEKFEPIDAFNKLIAATPNEYAKVSEILLTVSSEIILIDPYLDIRKKDRFDVISSLFVKSKNRNKQKSFIFFVSSKNINTIGFDIVSEARRLLKISCGAVNKLTIHLCDDETSIDRLHSRYLLTSHGALKFDMGFQKLNREIDVSVVGESVHQQLWQQFSNPENLPFEIKETVDISI